jgi:hypothetical protein
MEHRMADDSNSLEGEIWKPVVGYEAQYWVSSLGRVKTVPKWVNSKNGSFALKRERLLTPHLSKRTGYYSVSLHRGGKGRTVNVHRLVCEAFNGPAPDGKCDVAHNDGSRTNNAAENLRWATKQENALDRLIHGTQQMGEKQHLAKLTDREVLAMRAEYTGARGDLIRISQMFGVSATQVLNIVKRKHWKHI